MKHTGFSRIFALWTITPAANSTYPKGGVSCFADRFVEAESSVLRMKFSGKNPALRVAADRQDVKKLLYHDKSYGYLSLKFSYIRLSRAMI